GEREARHPDGSQGARVHPLRSVQRRPGAGAERRQIPSADGRGRARGIEEAQMREQMMIRHFAVATIGFALFACAAPQSFAQEAKESTEGLDMQAARAKMMTVRGTKIAYTKKWALSGVAAYQQKQKVSGTLGMWGSNYIPDGFLGGYWEAEFGKYQPDLKFE